MSRPDAWWGAFAVAVEGISSALREQRHMRVHWLCAGAVLLVVSGARFEAWAQALVLCCTGLVLGAELFNTALEAVVDIATPALHPLAKKAKDAAAGAVLVLALAAVVVLCIVLRNQWHQLEATLVRSTLSFGLPFLFAEALLLLQARSWVRWGAILGGTAALGYGWTGAGDGLHLGLLALSWILTVRLTSGWA